MTKSYMIDNAADNVFVITASYCSGYVVHCYEDDDCIYTQYFADYINAEEFGNQYLNSDWNKTGFPDMQNFVFVSLSKNTA